MIRLTDIAKAALIAQGGLAITFGVAAIFWPGLTVLVLAYLFAVFLVADGTFLLALGLLDRKLPHGMMRIVWGALQLLAGVFVLFHPGVSFAALVVVLGLCLAIRGLFGLAHAITRHGDAPSERTMHSVLGALGVIVGTIVVLQPEAGGLAFVWVVGVYALVTGTVLIALALGLGKVPRHKRKS